MRLALALKATGAEQAEVDVAEVEEAEVVGGARGKRRLDMIGFRDLQFAFAKEETALEKETRIND